MEAQDKRNRQDASEENIQQAEMATGMSDLERSALIRGESRVPSASSAPAKARHPRSRGERQLLDELQHSLASALEIAKAPGPHDALLAEADAALAKARPLAVASIPSATQFSSNGGPKPSLFYAPPPASGVGLTQRGTHFASAPPSGLSPDEDAALRHYGVQQLSDHARATLLGEVAHYLPSHRHMATCRQRFDALLARVQQHQLARTVQNELRAKQPDAMWNWNEDRFHLAPVTGAVRTPRGVACTSLCLSLLPA